MNKQTYIKLPNITINDLQKVVDYLDENDIKYIEYFEEENKLEKALNEIEKYIKQQQDEQSEQAGFYNAFVEFITINADYLLEIINKAKGND